MSHSEYSLPVRNLLKELQNHGFVEVQDSLLCNKIKHIRILSNLNLSIVAQFEKEKVYFFFYFRQNKLSRLEEIKFSDFFEKISNPLFKQILLFNLDLFV